MFGSRGHHQQPPLAISGYLHDQDTCMTLQLSSARCIMCIALAVNYPLSINATEFELSLILTLEARFEKLTADWKPRA